jgi:hypothetical protein
MIGMGHLQLSEIIIIKNARGAKEFVQNVQAVESGEQQNVLKFSLRRQRECPWRGRIKLAWIPAKSMRE